MSRHRDPDQIASTGHGRLEAEAWVLGAAVPDALGAELLARSDSSTVYRVVGPDMSSLVVKLVEPDVLATLHAITARVGAHAALVPLLHSGVEQQLGYAVFPYFGRTLADAIETSPIPAEELGRLLWPVADALAQLHRVGIVHADVKPSNIMLSAAGAAVLADLDEAGELGSVPRRVTVGFCPPEQITGRGLATQNDTYAFASTVLTALTGSTGWMADPAGWLASPMAGQLPGPVLAALRAALAADPTVRAAQPAELAGALTEGRPATVLSQPATDPVEPSPVLAERQVLEPVLAGRPGLIGEPNQQQGASFGHAASSPATAEPEQLSELAAAAQQVWGFVDLRAVTAQRLALQLQPPDPEPEALAPERPIWRHPAMIVSMALAAVLILIGIGLTLFG